MKKAIYILLCLICFKAEAQINDTVEKADNLKNDLLTIPDTVAHLRSSTWAMLPPSVAVVYGASNFFFPPVKRMDIRINNDITEDAPGFRHHPENMFQYTPAILVYGLNLVGVQGKNTFVDRTLILAMAQGIMNLTVLTLKRTTHRLRPDGSNYYSFPSGHTANAYLGAEFMAQEFGDRSVAYSAVGYSFATATGILRMYNRDHWFSDVVAGAGVGMLSTKAAYLLYPYLRKSVFKVGRKKVPVQENPDELKRHQKNNALLIPSYTEDAPGFHFSMAF